MPRQRVSRLNIQGFLKTAHRLAVHFFAKIRAAQVVVRKMSRFVTSRFHRLLQPRNGFIKLRQFDHVRANVVVGIAKIGIQFNGPLTLGNRIYQFALEMIGPAQKCVRFRRGMQLQRRLIEFHGSIVVAFHLRLVGVLQHFPRASQSLLIHAPIVNVQMQLRQRYESATCAWGETVLIDGVSVEIFPKNVQNEGAPVDWRGGTVNRTFANLLLAICCAVVLAAGMLYAQDSGKKSGGASAALGRGKTVFQQKCSICHYDNTDQKKIGPGLKGLNKRGTFTVNGSKITDDSLKAWIENGDQLMPPFKDQLEPSQLKDVIAYVKTL